MLKTIRKPFGYEPIINKEDIKGPGRKKKERASDWKSVLHRIWKLVDEQRGLLITVLALVFISSALTLLGPLMIGQIIDIHIIPMTFGGLAGKIGSYAHLGNAST
ncbi:hypothetical protein [Sporosarcina limicola]|uniref:ABC-type bacteriocin/lantibiotic exporter with double-glycine peptidase domain n=1 Tax=Sporosarcina limicola TaxID=34101 RepID=A0A927MJB6_9BACL|nr:hypothetical protein [Sporosarcina limicola]MBE1555769.1 ABC-type bacteriocin/lantibiotic exporter with double-glycine peptidase domain [Sporosarcina limicola]